MRATLVAALLVLLAGAPSVARPQVSFQIDAPGVSIGLNVPMLPQLVRVPGYPVYYAPRVGGNYFFYDGMYWVLQGDTWYQSVWFNGPWTPVPPVAVPAFLLRVPVRYYRAPPPWFAGWRADRPPRWGEHWGHDWEHRRAGWDRWDRHAAPPPAPLPAYQREYAGERYPRPDEQPGLHSRYYSYRPRDAEVRQAYASHGVHPGPPPGHDRGGGEKHGHGEGHGHGHD